KAQELTIDLKAENTRVRGDQARLQQVVWNLLKNASKFTPDKGKICVSTWNEGEDWIVVQVVDAGRGINPDALEVIFEPFRQEERAVSREVGGLGLGLAIAKATVAGHGGSIVAFSEGREKGSTFTVRLPLYDPRIGAVPA